ncbi:MAG TPA: AAA family ATPase [Candidatus Baltobacteraceae bacterium]|nr:AAA family ATPase [Candidatus Baltobacteraceae bacterium]
MVDSVAGDGRRHGGARGGVRFRLLGAFGIEVDDRPAAFRGPPKTVPLLAYLLLHRDVLLARSDVAFALWPDAPNETARANLRRHLGYLQAALPPGRWLAGDAKTLRWDGRASVDVTEFEALSADERGRAAAVELYGGDLLEAFGDEEWLLAERERLRALQIANLSALIVARRIDRDVTAAVEYARRLLSLDPAREDALRHIMALRTELGDRAGALGAYETFVRFVREELGVEPMPETSALADAIRRGEALDAPCAAAAGPAPMRGRGAELPFVGRTRELGRLREAWRSAVRGRAVSAAVSGESGIGKTRLLGALAEIAAAEGATVLTGIASAEGDPYGPIVDALRPHVVRNGDAAPPSALAALFPAPDTRAGERADSIDAERGAARLFDAVADELARLCAAHPVLLVLEDAHWASRALCALSAYLVRRLAGARFMLAFTHREEDALRTHPLAQLRRDLAAYGEHVRIALGPLARDAVDDLARTLKIVDAAERERFVAWIDARAEGNPFFVGELVREAVERGALRRPGDDGATFDVPRDEAIGDDVRAWVSARLGRLSPPTRTLSALAAVAGRAFDVEVLRRASGWSENRVLEALDELLDRNVVRESSESGLDYAFSHHLVHAVCYADAPADATRRRHRRVANALARRYAGRGDEHAAELAFHWERAGDAARAAADLVRAARAALSTFANADAEAYATRALALAQDDATRLAAHLAREEARRRIGDRAGQREDLAAARALARDDDARHDVDLRRVALAHVLGERVEEASVLAELEQRASTPAWRARVLRAKGAYLASRAQYEAARETLEEALRLEGDDASAVVATACALAEVALHQARYGEIDRVLERADTLARSAGDEELRYRLLDARYGVAYYRERTDALAPLARELLELACALGDRAGEALAHRRIGNALLFVFDVEEAARHFEQAVALDAIVGRPEARCSTSVSAAICAMAMGLLDEAEMLLSGARDAAHAGEQRFGEALVDANLAWLFILRGDVERAAALAESLLARARALDAPTLEVGGLCTLGTALRGLGRFDEAIRNLSAGVALQRRIGHGNVVAQDLAELTRAHLEAGDVGSARAHAEELSRLGRATRSAVVNEQYVSLIAARAFAAAGEPRRARDELAAALETLRAKAHALRDPVVRAAFEALPFNREVLAETAVRV